MGSPTGTVTFMFSDVEGSTQLWETHPSAMRPALEVHDGVFRTVADRHGGYVFSTMGDGFGIAFGRARDAVVASLEAQDRLGAVEWPGDIGLTVRIGLHLGEVQERDGDYFGSAVNLTARAMSAGHGGQIVATATVADVVGPDGLEIVDLGTHRLKGIGVPQRLVQLSAPGRSRTFPPLRTERPPRARHDTDTVLLEREPHLDALAERVELAAAGRGSLMLLGGPAGAGKSSVVREFVHRHEAECVVLQGACDPLSTPRPLGPLREIAADPAAGLGPVGGADRDVFDTFESLLGRLRVPPGPVVVVLEDVHWADDVTLDLIRYLGRRIGRSRSVVVCTFRDDEVHVDHPLHVALGHLAGMGDVERVDVEPLSRAAVRQLAGDRDVDADELYEVTGGNPFFVTEVIAAGGRLSATVGEAVMARVRSLGDGARAVVEAVAISPTPLDIDAARHLSSSSGDDVDSAAVAGILVADVDSLRFRHELARGAVEATLPPARRMAMHRQMLDLLVQRGHADVAELAHHALGTHDDPLILEHVSAAARHAGTVGATGQAISWYETAVAAADRSDPALASALRLELSSKYNAVGDFGAAIDAAACCVRYYGPIEDPDGRVGLARALDAQGRAQSNSGDSGGATASLAAATAVLDPDGPPAQLTEIALSSGLHHLILRDRQRTSESLDRARRSAEAAQFGTGGRLPVYEALAEMTFGSFEDGLAMVSVEQAAAEQRGDTELVGYIDDCVGTLAGELRRYEVGRRSLTAALALSVDRDQAFFAAYEWAWMAKIAFDEGEFAEATELLAEADIGRAGIHEAKRLMVLGRLRVRRGDPGGVELLDRATGSLEHDFLQHSWPIAAGHAEALWSMGRDNEIPERIGAVHDVAANLDSEWATGELSYWMWKAGAQTGDPGRMAEPYALQITGRWREAADAWNTIGAPFEVAMALAEGDVDARLRAVSVLDDLGAAPAAAIVRRDLRAAGVRAVPRGPASSTRGHPLGLTTRQSEVLALMTDGLGNGEIAERLFVSKKTVEHHVSAVLQRLGVATRAQAIAAANAAEST